jgi:hypothetical protein
LYKELARSVYIKSFVFKSKLRTAIVLDISLLLLYKIQRGRVPINQPLFRANNNNNVNNSAQQQQEQQPQRHQPQQQQQQPRTMGPRKKSGTATTPLKRRTRSSLPMSNKRATIDDGLSDWDGRPRYTNEEIERLLCSNDTDKDRESTASNLKSGDTTTTESDDGPTDGTDGEAYEEEGDDEGGKGDEGDDTADSTSISGELLGQKLTPMNSSEDSSDDEENHDIVPHPSFLTPSPPFNSRRTQATTGRSMGTGIATATPMRLRDAIEAKKDDHLMKALELAMTSYAIRVFPHYKGLYGPEETMAGEFMTEFRKNCRVQVSEIDDKEYHDR